MTNRDVKLINANPVHALGLKRGFGKSDVKKAYRSYALKYHPDKNQDCDTAPIFAGECIFVRMFVCMFVCDCTILRLMHPPPAQPSTPATRN